MPEEPLATCLSAAPDQHTDQVDATAADTTKKNCRRSLDFDVCIRVCCSDDCSLSLVLLNAFAAVINFVTVI